MFRKNYISSTLIFGLMALFVACSKPPPVVLEIFTPMVLGKWCQLTTHLSRTISRYRVGI